MNEMHSRQRSSAEAALERLQAERKRICEALGLEPSASIEAIMGLIEQHPKPYAKVTFLEDGSFRVDEYPPKVQA